MPKTRNALIHYIGETPEFFAKTNGLTMVRASTVGGAAFENLPPLQASEIRTYTWPKARNGLDHDVTLVMLVYIESGKAAAFTVLTLAE